MRVGVFWDALSVVWEEKKSERRHIAELVRGGTMRLWNLQVQKKYRVEDPAKFWPMPWDAASETAARHAGMTQKERDKAAKDFLKKIGELNDVDNDGKDET